MKDFFEQNVMVDWNGSVHTQRVQLLNGVLTIDAVCYNVAATSRLGNMWCRVVLCNGDAVALRLVDANSY